MRVLDVGCGTGIASREFVDQGAEVIGVEADPRMAEVGRRTGLTIEVSRFEDWTPGGEPFDLVISAQAWHWIDLQRGPHLAADVLRPGGRLAVFWNGYHHQPEVSAVFAEVYGRVAPQILVESVALGSTVVRRGATGSDLSLDSINASDRFEAAVEQSYPWTRTYTLAQWIDELPTHSDHRMLPPAELDELLTMLRQRLAALTGPIVVDFITHVITAIRLELTPIRRGGR